MVLSARAPAISSAGEEPDIPPALLRASCDLEILIPARDEVPAAAAHAHAYGPVPGGAALFVVCRGD